MGNGPLKNVNENPRSILMKAKRMKKPPDQALNKIVKMKMCKLLARQAPSIESRLTGPIPDLRL
jgi:hypothetical protein